MAGFGRPGEGGAVVVPDVVIVKDGVGEVVEVPVGAG